ncbi:MAG: hypothetical protein ACR2QV_12345 [Gammaproteobacteria bacterium]
MKHIRIKAFVAASCFAVAGSANAFVGSLAVSIGQMNKGDAERTQTSFSADAKFETEDQQGTSKVNYRPGMVRDTLDMGGNKMTMIYRYDEKKVIMEMGNGMYMERAIDEPSKDQAPDYKLVSREVVGKEIVNGMETTKYKSVYESKDGKFGGFTWYTADDIAVKGFIVSEEGGEKTRMKFELSNVVRGEQSPDLFRPAPGSRKFNTGGFAGLGGMGGMSGMNEAQRKEMEEALRKQQQQQGDYRNMPPTEAYDMSGMQQDQMKSMTPSGDLSGLEEQQQGGDTNIVEDVAAEATETAVDTAQESTDTAVETASDSIVDGVADGVKKGFGKLFGR